MYLSPSRVPRGLAPEAGIDSALRDSYVLLGKKNLGTEEVHGLGMNEEQVTFGGDGARESNKGILGEGARYQDGFESWPVPRGYDGASRGDVFFRPDLEPRRVSCVLHGQAKVPSRVQFKRS